MGLRYVRRYRDRHGRARVYYTPPHGARVALPDLPEDDPRFLRAYLDAQQDRPQTGPRSIDTLAAHYYRSADYRALRPSSANMLRREIERIRQAHAHRPVAGLRPRHIRALLAPLSPGAASNHLKAWRALCRCAVDLDWIDRSPAADVRRPRQPGAGRHSWTAAEIAQYRGRWLIGTRERLALDILLATGQRRGDVCRMDAADMDQGGIWVTQEKTGARLWCPVSPDLWAQLPRRGPLVPTTRGKAYNGQTFGAWFADACTVAGLPERCRAHGLRKAAAAELAEAGATQQEIKALTGHTTDAEVARYVAAAQQRKLAASGHARRSSNQATNLRVVASNSNDLTP